MPEGHRIIVIGTSAGGVEALSQLVEDVPETIPASIFVVLHTSAESPGLLPSILESKTKLPVYFPKDKSALKTGCICVAPPDHHLLVEQSRVRVVRGPKENRHRPAVDPLFRSAAWSHGPRVVGVVLTGMLDDGTAGLWAIKTCGGKAVVQDPADALYPQMPSNALHNVEIDYCLPLARIPRLLDLLARKKESVTGHPVPEKVKLETEVAIGEKAQEIQRLGRPSSFACPSCRGTMWEVKDGEVIRYRCHVGHGFMPESLLAEQTDSVESALYSALSIMQEKIVLLRTLARQLQAKSPDEARLYADSAEEQEKHASQILRLLQRVG